MVRTGRPSDVSRFIQCAKDDELYGVGSLLTRCIEIGALDLTVAGSKVERQMIRNAARSQLRRFLRNHLKRFFPEPDGALLVTRPIRGEIDAWYGHTWKKAVRLRLAEERE